MLEINLVDDSFNKNNTQYCHLSMQSGRNGFSFTILDLSSLRYLVLRHYSGSGIKNDSELADYFSLIYNQDEFLKLSYKSKSHLFVDKTSVVIPDEFFDDTDLDNYLNFTFAENQERVAAFNTLSSIVCKNVFSYPVLLNTILKSKFTEISLFHFSTPFIQYLTKSSKDKMQTICFVYMNDTMLSIGLAQNSKLIFYNTYEYKSKNDIVYFILSAFEQYSLSAKTTEVFISSDTNKQEEIFDFLNDYLGQIKFIQACSDYKYSRLFDELHLTRFVNLFNLAHCE